jgi:hypothetical protein
MKLLQSWMCAGFALGIDDDREGEWGRVAVIRNRLRARERVWRGADMKNAAEAALCEGRLTAEARRVRREAERSAVRGAVRVAPLGA